MENFCGAVFPLDWRVSTFPYSKCRNTFSHQSIYYISVVDHILINHLPYFGLQQVVIPQIEPLTDQQVIDVCNLRQSSQQTEDALSQGMEKLQQTLSEEVGVNLQLGYIDESLVAAAMDKLEALESFVNQVRTC